MKRIGMFTIILTIIVSSTCLSDPNLKDRTLVKLENMNSMVVVDLGGGSIVDFHLKEHELNPLTWNYPDEGDTDPRSMGHFICLDRWGAASKAETKWFSMSRVIMRSARLYLILASARMFA